MRNLNYIDENVYRFRISFQKNDGNFYSYYFDAQESEDVMEKSEITEHPTSEGLNIADNTYPLPRNINIKVLVAYINTGKRPSGEFYTWFGNREDALNSLRDLRINGTVCTLYTKHKIYENMVLQQVSTNNSGNIQLDLPISLSFKEVRFAQYKGYVVTENEAMYVDDASESDSNVISKTNGDLVGDIANELIPIGTTLVGVAAGAKIGAVIGSVGGPIGSLGGAVIGGIIGAAIGFFMKRR